MPAAAPGMRIARDRSAQTIEDAWCRARRDDPWSGRGKLWCEGLKGLCIDSWHCVALAGGWCGGDQCWSGRSEGRGGGRRGIHGCVSNGQSVGPVRGISIRLSRSNVVSLHLVAGGGRGGGGRSFLVAEVRFCSCGCFLGKGRCPHFGSLGDVRLVGSFVRRPAGNFGRSEGICLGLRDANGRVDVGRVVLYPADHIVVAWMA